MNKEKAQCIWQYIKTYTHFPEDVGELYSGVAFNKEDFNEFLDTMDAFVSSHCWDGKHKSYIGYQNERSIHVPGYDIRCHIIEKMEQELRSKH